MSRGAFPLNPRNFTAKLARFVRIGTIYTPGVRKALISRKNHGTAKGGTLYGG